MSQDHIAHSAIGSGSCQEITLLIVPPEVAHVTTSHGS